MKHDPSGRPLLWYQKAHRSQRVWDEGSSSTLRCRQHLIKDSGFMAMRDDERIVPLLRSSGFYGVSRLDFISLDQQLISALVERWRPESHTFHFPSGEATVTLQDVALLFGLPIDGRAVTGVTDLEWVDVCRQLLGRTPVARQHVDGGRVLLTWLTDQLSVLPPKGDPVFDDPNLSADEIVAQYARAYILTLMGGLVFPDLSGNKVHCTFLPLLADLSEAGEYSWGAACLSWLYRQLCRASSKDATQIGGSLLLLQIWAWDRMPFIAPLRTNVVNLQPHLPLACRWAAAEQGFDWSAMTGHHSTELYRELFDGMLSSQIVWQPYTELISLAPDYCLAASNLWIARVPLVCFWMVEWHYPDRVVRQFGGLPIRPGSPSHVRGHDEIDLRGKTEYKWADVFAAYIGTWECRHENVISLCLTPPPDYDHTDYMMWYDGITRRYIGRTGSLLGNWRDSWMRVKDCNDLEEVKSIARRALEEDQDRLAVQRKGNVPIDDDGDDHSPPAPPCGQRGHGRVLTPGLRRRARKEGDGTPRSRRRCGQLEVREPSTLPSTSCGATLGEPSTVPSRPCSTLGEPSSVPSTSWGATLDEPSTSQDITPESNTLKTKLVTSPLPQRATSTSSSQAHPVPMVQD